MSYSALSFGAREGAESISFGYALIGIDDAGIEKVNYHVTTVYYKDYPVYGHLPLAAQCEAVRFEWAAYWQKVKREAQAKPAEAIGL